MHIVRGEFLTAEPKCIEDLELQTYLVLLIHYMAALGRLSDQLFGVLF